jgi:O-acetyl-ADP-ribose deacetylase (regulator of RNase III)
LEERRENYYCGPKEFQELKDIPTWQDHFIKNKKSLSEKVSEKDHNQFKEENADLAETNSTDDICKLASKVSLFVGDITKLEIDAIVNAANESLLGGGGVDGAIHRAAGKMLLSECRTLCGCETGNAKLTCGYKLPSKCIIHTVGPRGIKPQKLQSCYKTSLDLLTKNNLRTIAFPCISTGIYGYPSHEAAPVAIKTVRTFLESNFDKVDRVLFTLFLDKDVDKYEKQMQFFFPVNQQTTEVASSNAE